MTTKPLEVIAMRQKKNIIMFCTIILGVGLAFLIWTEFGYLWTSTYGIQWGLIAGAVTGAIVLPLVRDSLVGGRAIVGAVAGLLIVGFIQALQFGSLVQGSTSILSPDGMVLLGEFGLVTIIRLLYAMAGGILLALLITVPQLVVVGGVIGLLIGALVGSISHTILIHQGIILTRELFLVLVGMVTLSLFAMLGSSRTG
jgi:hypothetical protein